MGLEAIFSWLQKTEGGFPGCSAVKNLPANSGDAKDVGLIPGLGRSPGNPLQYSSLENLRQAIQNFFHYFIMEFCK